MFVTWCVLSAGLLCSASAQVFSLGNCNSDMETMKDFNTTRYVGKWYEIKRAYNEAQENTKCYRVQFNLDDKGGYNVNGTFVTYHEHCPGVGLSLTSLLFFSKKTNKYEERKDNTMCWTAQPSDKCKNPEKMDLGPGFVSDLQPLVILDTDYNNFGVGYSCMNAYKGKLEFAWIVARVPNPCEAIIAKAENVLKKRNIKLNLITDVQDCE